MFKKSALAFLWLAVSSSILLGAPLAPPNPAPDDEIIGRWDMTTIDANGNAYPSWFEVTRDSGRLVGRFVGRVGSQRPIQAIEFANGHLKFTLPPQFERRKTDLEFQANLKGDRLDGTFLDSDGKLLKWTAVRAPKLERKSTPRWGKPVTLFGGRDMSAWRLRDIERAGAWRVSGGVLENTPRGTDIITEQEFRDFKLHVEFKMAEKSNSGVYLRGRYEVQIQDDFGKEPESHRNGGVYGFLTPSSNPVKKAGEWQSFDITLIGRKVTVVLNDKTIIDNVEIPGITGGALDSKEGEAGPIMLQGDHEQIYFRNIVITPAK
ncbi:MAG TPA: DUF1080 domain-containing protein [Blastocatellia bacterium]|nr:DUF1080 domain-containing protein [Blastocatellia bacterium]